MSSQSLRPVKASRKKKLGSNAFLRSKSLPVIKPRWDSSRKVELEQIRGSWGRIEDEKPRPVRQRTRSNSGPRRKHRFVEGQPPRLKRQPASTIDTGRRRTNLPPLVPAVEEGVPFLPAGQLPQLSPREGKVPTLEKRSASECENVEENVPVAGVQAPGTRTTGGAGGRATGGAGSVGGPGKATPALASLRESPKVAKAGRSEPAPEPMVAPRAELIDLTMDEETRRILALARFAGSSAAVPEGKPCALSDESDDEWDIQRRRNIVWGSVADERARHGAIKKIRSKLDEQGLYPDCTDLYGGRTPRGKTPHTPGR